MYSKFSEVSVGFHRNDTIRTINFFGVYTTNAESGGYLPQIHYSMQITVFADLLTAEVQGMELGCTIADGRHDTIQTIFLENIEQEILTADCHNVKLPASWLTPPEGHDSYPISIGNRDFEIGYSFASGLGTLESATVNVETLSISLGVAMHDADTLAIKLENEMLKHLEIESDLHYCVGNQFIVLIDDEPAASNNSKYGHDELIIMSLTADSKLVEIIGEDLLYSPRVCP